MTPQELAQMIWNIKEIIRDDYNDKNVDEVILPFTLLRRLDCVMDVNKDIVKQVPLSRRLLEVRFRQVTGQSIYQYISDLRMERFSQLLLASTDSIADLAIQVGLADSKNLARQFKLWKGCTPIEFRKQNRVK